MTVAAANITLDLTLVKYEAPKEYQPLGRNLPKKHKDNAETGMIYVTARRLGALFEVVCPLTPRLVEAYGLRVSEILEALKACMLAQTNGGAEAISVLVELVKERKEAIASAFKRGEELPNLGVTAALQTDMPRFDSAEWDASARAWLRAADSVRAVEQRQLMTFLDKVDISVSRNLEVYASIVSAWKSALRSMEQLIRDSEEDKRAALTYCNCAVAVAFMLKIIEGFLKGLYTKIDEVNMELQETPRRIYLVDEHGNLDTTEYGHTLLRVSLKSGESYAFDLTGAQFGYYETITPWSLYKQSRAKKGSIAFSPSDLRLTLIIAASSNSPTVPGITWRYNKSLANVVKGTCEEFADMKGTGAVCDMLKLAQVAFECKSDQLVYCVAKVLTNFKAELKRQGRLPRARPFQIGEVWHDERSGC